jgi:hypothetical protein
MEINPKFKVGDKVFNIYDTEGSQEDLGEGLIEEVIVQVKYKVRFRKDNNRTYKCLEDELSYNKRN